MHVPFARMWFLAKLSPAGFKAFHRQSLGRLSLIIDDIGRTPTTTVQFHLISRTHRQLTQWIRAPVASLVCETIQGLEVMDCISITNSTIPAISEGWNVCMKIKKIAECKLLVATIFCWDNDMLHKGWKCDAKSPCSNLISCSPNFNVSLLLSVTSSFKLPTHSLRELSAPSSKLYYSSEILG
jgi:hypothetical protein